jgi:hypothetical protein
VAKIFRLILLQSRTIILICIYTKKGDKGSSCCRYSFVNRPGDYHQRANICELGFLLIYRYGWSLGTGNLVTGVFINLILIGLGMTFLGEKVNLINAIGIASCVLGVALISYRP